jgi:hypothetical protein
MKYEKLRIGMRNVSVSNAGAAIATADAPNACNGAALGTLGNGAGKVGLSILVTSPADAGNSIVITADVTITYPNQ